MGSTVEDYFYGDDDELIEIKIGSTVVKSFAYDAAGRRTSATYSGVTTNYAYDYESRITSITRTGVAANSFSYNGLDTRVSKTDSAGTTSYKRAGASVTDSLLKSTVSSTTTDYTPGVSSRVGSDSTFMHSGIKNADTQTDDGGDVSAMRQYDAFGNPVATTGTWAGPFGYGGPYGYQTDTDHALMLLGHRYYEPETGRFLTRDPIKDGRNWYGYCDGSPLGGADPDGQDWKRLAELGVLGLELAIDLIYDIPSAVKSELPIPSVVESPAKGLVTRGYGQQPPRFLDRRPFALFKTPGFWQRRDGRLLLLAFERTSPNKTAMGQTLKLPRSGASGGGGGAMMVVIAALPVVAAGIWEVVLYRKRIRDIDSPDGRTSDLALGVDPNYDEWDMTKGY